ncbi:bifunctional DNA-formamidopyrimidine glycosylase/DNA-(apurinic or apyrimidinic site) lyase [Gryllotalpicola reticulitermitis]|uniref:Formamidopyrimidine-DNA glycosylase n=1 Tax=Gryllotalpicola reticulitermitis TaxID=1184153 RepID=A0ABV8Q323_9MICO
MPELPEVEVVRLGLAAAVTGAEITAVDVFDERALTRHDRARGDFASQLTGERMGEPHRRGKFLWIPLTDSSEGTGARGAGDPRCLLAHLGMTGQLLIRDPWAKPEDEPHVRIRIELRQADLGGRPTDPAVRPRREPHVRAPIELAIFFRDQRTFGSLAVDELVETGDGDLVPRQVAHINRDPLDPLFDDRAFLARVAAKTSAIKRVLLDQTTISGVGNIYADEALWAARIHPEQPASSLSRTKAKRLLGEIRLVLGKALIEGGTSFDSQYVNVNGQAGYFVHSLNAYGRTGQPCPRCGHSIARASFMNRSSHFCPHCQRVR